VFDAHVRADMAVDVATVASRVGSREWRLLDARAPERFRGEVEPIDRTPGHIPGAVNYFFGANVEADKTFKTPEQLRAQLAPALGATPPDHVICYCGSGVTACHNLLAMEHAGLRGAKLYVGSWSEWSADPSRPVEKG
jgi:thiosulfate/3-mercaptopyruvate sulfurtransferase